MQSRRVYKGRATIAKDIDNESIGTYQAGRGQEDDFSSGSVWKVVLWSSNGISSLVCRLFEVIAETFFSSVYIDNP